MKLSLRYRFIVIHLTLFLFQIVGCGTLSNENILPTPHVAPSTKSILQNGWFDDTPFWFSGLAFFDGHLYASSSRGLIKLSEGKISHVYQWSNVNEVTEEVFFDKANNLLWFRHVGLKKFIHFDGSNWVFVPLPINETTLSRGDVLRGFRLFSTSDTLFLQGREDLWEWNIKENNWQRLQMPKLNCHSDDSSTADIRCFVDIASTNNNLFAIIRRSYVFRLDGVMSRAEPTEKDSDIVLVRQDNEWNEISNQSGNYFFAKEVINGQNSVFILTYRNEIINISENGIALIKPPGKVQVLTSRADDSLLVSIENDGIYEYDGRWRKLFDSPYPSDIGEHFSYLAERGGKIVFAINYTYKTKQLPCNINNSSSMWVFDKDLLSCAFSED